MCGRFSLFADDDELVSLFDIDLLMGENGPSWNVAPGQQVRAVMDREVPTAAAAGNPGDPAATDPPSGVPGSSATAAAAGNPGDPATGAPPSSIGVVGGNPQAPAHPTRVERQLRLLEWGLVPSWARPPLRPMINARAETLTQKPSFRSAASRRRCLVPANGYFEWQVAPGGSGPKQPWFLSGGEGDPVVAFAGIYEAWRDREAGPDAPWLLTCAIITRSAPDALGEIHDRMPVVVPPEMWDAWLDPDLTDGDQVQDLIGSIPAPNLVPRKVGRAVGNVRNDGPELIEGID